MRLPAGHPLARHMAAAAAAEPQRHWSPGEPPLPALYLGHGAPPLLEDAQWMHQLWSWARSMPAPSAALILSAHWESAPLALSSTAPGTELVYDFAGFDPLYSTLRYDTPDASATAGLVRSVLPDRWPVVERRRGLDHGAWVPLLAMYPAANVPVLQLSVPTHDPGALLDLGAALRPLREHGVLVIGSGFLTHGLPFIDWRRPDAVPGWSRDFDLWAAQALSAGDVEELSRFRTAPGMPYAHPSVEHFTPLFVALGAGDDPAAPVTTTIDGYFIGLAKRSFQTAGYSGTTNR